MKYLNNILCTLLFAALAAATIMATSASAEVVSSPRQNIYDPAKVYPGSFGANVMYYRYPNSYWRRGMAGTYPDVVACADALKHFKKTGLWQGHFGRGGVCGAPGEPTEWAVGNRLNFDAQFKVGN
jgi:hypothetical protein